MVVNRGGVGWLLATAVITAAVAAASPARAADPECEIILPAVADLEAAFDLVDLGAAMPPNTGTRIQSAASRLHGLTSPAAIDLRLRASTVSEQINGTNPYHRAPLARDLETARLQLAETRAYCAA